MSPPQQRGLALWASLLSALVCLLFLPVPRWGAWLIRSEERRVGKEC